MVWVKLFLLIPWPINLFLANTSKDFLSYCLPAILLGLGYFSVIPIFIIPIVQPKLAIFPLLWMILARKPIKHILLALLIFVVFLKPFWGQTIFIKDYEAQQEIIRETQLYKSIFLARLYHNKARIVFDKAISNFFVLTDPSNYFFGNHPREIPVNNQNLVKFHFLTIPFFVYFSFNFKKNRRSKFILTSLLACIISLSLLTNFDRNDFILLVPLSLILFP